MNAIFSYQIDMKNFKGLKLKGERQAVCWEIKLMPAFFSGII